MSMYFFAHKEKNVHWMVREEFKWRVHMPDDSPNPNQEQRSTIPQGFDTVPMYHDIMSDKPVGSGSATPKTSSPSSGGATSMTTITPSAG